MSVICVYLFCLLIQFLQCMSLLAHEIESKEVLAFICLKPLRYALKVICVFDFATLRG